MWADAEWKFEVREMPRVLKRKNFLEPIPKGAVLVARPSRWNNPFKIGQDGTREKVIQKYGAYIAKRIRSGELDVMTLRGTDLVCYRAPLPCHGDVLLEPANGPLEKSAASP